jgi:hypothetical protein
VKPSLDRTEFERCWPWIEAAAETEVGGASYTKDDVWSEIACGNAQFWPGKKSAEVTATVIHPRRKFLQAWLGGGNLKELISVILPALEEYARINDYSHIVGTGRSAWGRVLERHGFEAVSTNFAKPIIK